MSLTRNFHPFKWFSNYRGIVEMRLLLPTLQHWEVILQVPIDERRQLFTAKMKTLAPLTPHPNSKKTTDEFHSNPIGWVKIFSSIVGIAQFLE